MIMRDTPPSSPRVTEHDIESDEMEDDDLLYVGDVDEVLNILETEDNDDLDDESASRDDAVCVFNYHEGSVFCGSLNTSGTLAATGGEDNKAVVWEVESGQIVLECSGHTDSVIFSEFNHDCSYLATADMSGVVQVWKMSTKLLIWSYNMGDMTWMQWHPVANILFGGSASGEIYLWKIPSGDVKILQTYGQRFEIGLVMPDGKHIVAGYEDGVIRLFDLKSGRVTGLISPDIGHNSSITALDYDSNHNLLISAAVDGKTILSTTTSLKVISVLQDLRQSKPLDIASTANVTELSSMTDMDEERDDWVETIAFCKDPEFHVFATGTVRGQIFIWDIGKQVLRYVVRQESGISKLLWHLQTSVLYSSGLDGIVRTFNARSGQHIRSFFGHSADILDMRHSSDGKVMLTTSDDFTARIMKLAE